MVGVDDDTDRKGSVKFEILVDDKKVAESGRMVGGDAAKRLEADLHGAKRMTLLVGDADDGMDFDHADWAGALIVLGPEVKTRPQTIAMFETTTVPVDIVHPDSPSPVIHGARIVGGTPGHAFQFLIPATGEKPLHFARQEPARGAHAGRGDGHHQRSAPAAGHNARQVGGNQRSRHEQPRADDCWRRAQTGPHAADGLELVELLGRRGERCQGPRSGRLHRQERAGRSRLSVRKY